MIQAFIANPSKSLPLDHFGRFAREKEGFDIRPICGTIGASVIRFDNGKTPANLVFNEVRFCPMQTIIEWCWGGV